MVTRDKNDPGSTLSQRQESTHNIAVALGPVKLRAQAPPVDDVADQIQFVARMPFEKVQQSLGLTAAGAEMDIGQKNGSKVTLFGLVPERLVHAMTAPVVCMTMARSGDASVTCA
jgi:hypothetical protein